VSGDFSHADTVEFDAQGNVNEVAGFQELSHLVTMGSARFESGKLLFRWSDRNDASELEMTLIDSDTATLRFINDVNLDDEHNLRHLKPFHLRKSGL
jgi:hypothetical protein